MSRFCIAHYEDDRLLPWVVIDTLRKRKDRGFSSSEAAMRALTTMNEEDEA